MRVLFVSGGNRPDGRILPAIARQAQSLLAFADIDHYLIKGRGVKGYIKNVRPLRETINAGKYEIIHAHYAFSGIVAALATSKPVLTSLMGSDVNKNRLWKLGIKLFNRFCWHAVIVKSPDMKRKAGIHNAKIIPNGVDLERFRPLDKAESQREVGFASDVKHVLFLADPNRPEKNVELAKKAVQKVRRSDVALDIIHDIAPGKVPVYLNASDVVLLTSTWEGSPNVVKEAMACSRPIVSTDVGDVKDLIGGIDGCYIAHSCSRELAIGLRSALMFEGVTAGRTKVAALHDKNIAKQVYQMYREILCQVDRKYSE